MGNTSAYLSDHLKSYFENKFIIEEKERKFSQEENSAVYWENYLNHSTEEKFEILRKFYPQLNFPIKNGINKTQPYIDAVLKGKSYSNQEAGLQLNFPENINIKIYESISGKIPVVIIPDDEDFRTIIQALLYKNNPSEIPLSMGASLVNGINNWHRIHDLKKEFLKNNPFGNWNGEFSKNILQNTDLYKDTLVILSTKSYSNVSAEQLKLSEKVWLSNSLSIRLYHECTHLYTLKKYGCASNNLHDELIADYIGITKTYGSYNKVWMLQFMGLEKYPEYRVGARLENYFSRSEFSEADFKILITCIKNAVDNISAFDAILGIIKSSTDQIYRIQSLCETDLAHLSAQNGLNLIIKKYNELCIQGETTDNS